MTPTNKRHATATAHEAGAQPETSEFTTEATNAEAIARRAIETLRDTNGDQEGPEAPAEISAAYLNPTTIAAKITWYRGADWFLMIEMQEIPSAN